jgi:uncharacterized membrane protein YhiD involved in acid resistance
MLTWQETVIRLFIAAVLGGLIAGGGTGCQRDWLPGCRRDSTGKEIVTGLTTAAGIWAVAAIGLAVGGGLYIAALFATAVHFLPANTLRGNSETVIALIGQLKELQGIVTIESASLDATISDAPGEGGTR